MSVSSQNNDDGDHFNNYSYFTPELSKLPDEFLRVGSERNLNQRLLKNKSDDESSSSEDSDDSKEPDELPPELDSKPVSQDFSENLNFLDLTKKYTRKHFWNFNLYEKSEFKRRMEFCLRKSFFVAVTLVIFSLPSIKHLVVEQGYIVIFVIGVLSEDINNTILNSVYGLFGVGLAQIFPYLCYYIFPLTKGSTYGAILFSTLFMMFITGMLPLGRAWFIVHNIYYFYILLHDLPTHPRAIFFPIQQLLEFVIATVICVISSLIPFPTNLFRSVNFKIRLAFEQSLASFKLLMIVFTNPSSARASILLAQANMKISSLIKSRDYLQNNIGSLWIECIFDQSKFLETEVMLKIINNMVIFLNCLESLAIEYVHNSKDLFGKNMIDELHKFLNKLEPYAEEILNCFMDKKRNKKIRLQIEMKSSNDDLWSSYRNSRYACIHFEKTEDKSPGEHLFLDFMMFCINGYFCTFTLIDHIYIRRRTNKRKRGLSASQFYKSMKEKLNKSSLLRYVTSVQTYLVLLQNTFPVLASTAFAFFTGYYDNTMDIVFPVGFCWSDRPGGTFNKNLQRLLGTLFGAFFGLFVFTIFKHKRELYILATAMFISCFYNTFIGFNPNHSYFANVSAYTTSWILLTENVDGSIDFTTKIFTKIQLTFLGVLISVFCLMILNPKRSASIIKERLRDNIIVASDTLEAQKEAFDDIELKEIDEKEIPGMIYKLIKRNIESRTTLVNWDPISLYDFTNSDKVVVINDLLYKLEKNYKFIANLLVEAENEPNLFLKRVNIKLLERIAKATENFTNFVLICAHAANDSGMKNIVPYEGLYIDYNLILSELVCIIKNLLLFMRSPNKVPESVFEADFNKAKIFVKRIDENFKHYYHSVKKFVVKKDSEEEIDVSFEQYHNLWGLNAFIYSMKQSLQQIIILQQLIFFAKENKVKFTRRIINMRQK